MQYFTWAFLIRQVGGWLEPSFGLNWAVQVGKVCIDMQTLPIQPGAKGEK